MLDSMEDKSKDPYGRDIPVPTLDHLGRTPKEAKKYTPATDDPIHDDSDYHAWLDDMGLQSLENPVAQKTSEPNNDNKKQINTLVFRDHNLTLPELHLKVAILGPPEDTKGFPALFTRAYCEEAKDLYDADLAVFTGGPDVDPAYYGEKAVPSFYGDDERDFTDMGSLMTCLEEGIPMLGICRGAQFLAAMQGFKLVQDLDNHQSDHSMWDVRQSFLIENVSSRHHQAVIPGPGMDVLAHTHVSTQKQLNPSTVLDKSLMGLNTYPRDVEAYFIRKTCSIGIQGHPEYKRYNAFAKWCLDLLNEFIILNEDITWVKDRRRLRPELLKEEKLVRADMSQKLLTAKE